MRRLFILLATTGTLLGVGIGLLNPVFKARWQAEARVVFAEPLSDSEMRGIEMLLTEKAKSSEATISPEAGNQGIMVSYTTPDREASVRLVNDLAQQGAAAHDRWAKDQLLKNRLSLEVAADDLEAEAVMVSQFTPQVPAFTQHFTTAMASQAKALREVSATQGQAATNLPETKVEQADLDATKRLSAVFWEPALYAGGIGLAWGVGLGAIIALFSRRKRSECLFAGWAAIGTLAGAVAGLSVTNFMPSFRESTAVFQPLVRADFPKQDWLGFLRSRAFTEHVVKHAQLEKKWQMSAEDAVVKLEQQRTISLDASAREIPILRATVHDTSLNDAAMLANAYHAVLLAKLEFIFGEQTLTLLQQQRGEDALRNRLATLASAEEDKLQAIAVAEAAKSRLIAEQAAMPPVVRVLARAETDPSISKPDKPRFILLWVLGGLTVGALAGLLHASRPPRAKPPEQETGEIGETSETPLAYARG